MQVDRMWPITCVLAFVAHSCVLTSCSDSPSPRRMYSTGFDSSHLTLGSPTNESTFHQWTIGPVYYSALVMAEAMGPSNTTQVLDLQANNNNEFTPAYAIYEAGDPVRVALFNYITDASGASDVTAVISVAQGAAGGGGATPAQVKVKYLVAPSVSTKGNTTWAGQVRAFPLSFLAQRGKRSCRLLAESSRRTDG